MSDPIKVLLPANEIPVGSRVTKRTGDKVYTLRNEIKVFGLANSNQVLKGEDGVRFLIAPDGNAGAVDGQTELLWHTDKKSLSQWLEEQLHIPQ